MQENSAVKAVEVQQTSLWTVWPLSPGTRNSPGSRRRGVGGVTLHAMSHPGRDFGSTGRFLPRRRKILQEYFCQQEAVFENRQKGLGVKLRTPLKRRRRTRRTRPRGFGRSQNKTAAVGYDEARLNWQKGGWPQVRCLDLHRVEPVFLVGLSRAKRVSPPPSPDR